MRNLIRAAAERANVGPGIGINFYGQRSVELNWYFGEGRGKKWLASITLACSSKNYWITVDWDVNSGPPRKWCMPRSEVSSDRADLFLMKVLNELAGGESLTSAVSVVLGIDPLPSISYARDFHAAERVRKARAASIDN